MSKRIMIVEDHPLVAEATRTLLANSGESHEIKIVESAGAAMEAISLAEPWDLILLDLDVPGAVGLSLASHFKSAGLASRTCILTGTSRTDYVARARIDGFLGYVFKAARTSDLDSALKSLMRHETVFPGVPEEHAKTRYSLTNRQRQVLHWVSVGLTSKFIAKEMGLTPGSVDNLIAGSIAALEAKTRSEAVKKALELGLIRTDSP